MQLQFDEYNDMKFFNVIFESDSRERNRIMNVFLDGFSLDTGGLRVDHPGLYLKIVNKMQKKAKAYWDDQEAVNEQLMNVPTLAYQKEHNKTIASFGKIISAIILFFILPAISFAQKSDTIFVKKVFLNGKAINVKPGYIVKKSEGVWEVNGKDVKLYAYKKTNDPDFKPDTSIAKK